MCIRDRRYGYPISCLMIAVDRLGHLRDMYGYEAKEEIVEAVVELLKGATRSSDFLGRMADDRLLAVVPHTGRPGLEFMCERILAAARKLGFENQGRTIEISISIGASYDGLESSETVAGSPEPDRTMFFDALLQSAEEGLMEAIEDGGGKVSYFSPGELGGA